MRIALNTKIASGHDSLRVVFSHNRWGCCIAGDPAIARFDFSGTDRIGRAFHRTKADGSGSKTVSRRIGCGRAVMAMYLLVCGALPITSARGFLLERLLANFSPAGSAFVRDLHLALVTLMLQYLARVERV